MDSCKIEDFFPDWTSIISAGLVIGSTLAQHERAIKWISSGVTKEGALFSSLINSLGMIGVIQLTHRYRIDSNLYRSFNKVIAYAIRSFTSVPKTPTPPPPPARFLCSPIEPLPIDPLFRVQVPKAPQTKMDKLQHEMRNPLYPQEFLTYAPKDPHTGKIKSNLLRDSGDAFKNIYEAITKLEDIPHEDGFLGKGLYDLYDIQFQNLALRLTNDLSQDQLFSLQNQGLYSALVYRARGIAISSREDLDWRGKSIATDKEKIKAKEAEIQAYYNSFVIYNPNIKKVEIPPPLFADPVVVRVVCKKTTAALLELLNDPKNDPNEISSLIMANRIMMGGGHQFMHGTQEETTGGDSGLFAIMSTKSELSRGRAVYQKGYALPPGGVSYCNTRLFDGTNEGKGRECSYLVAGFADFRSGDRYTHSEFSEYAEGGSLKIDDSYRSRIKLDMINVVEFAISKRKTRLILGGSGCGAFEHNVEEEAKGWQEVLDKYKYHFKEVIFAIFDQSTAESFRKILILKSKL